MFSDRANLIREKQFPLSRQSGEGHHLAFTLTDNHTLFLLNQEKERSSRIEKKSWWVRLLRRS